MSRTTTNSLAKEDPERKRNEWMTGVVQWDWNINVENGTISDTIKLTLEVSVNEVAFLLKHFANFTQIFWR